MRWFLKLRILHFYLWLGDRHFSSNVILKVFCLNLQILGLYVFHFGTRLSVILGRSHLLRFTNCFSNSQIFNLIIIGFTLGNFLQLFLILILYSFYRRNSLVTGARFTIYWWTWVIITRLRFNLIKVYQIIGMNFQIDLFEFVGHIVPSIKLMLWTHWWFCHRRKLNIFISTLLLVHLLYHCKMSLF